MAEDYDTNGAATDDTLLALNTSIETALRDYFPVSDGMGIIFNLPETLTDGADNTISVFLYQIQEDLELRTGEARQYDAATGELLPGLVSIKCCYLITYWDATAKEDNASDARSQTMVTTNKIVNALINNRQLPVTDLLPSSYGRILPPSEHLNSMSNFWQSMGDKPRLCLNYEVTIPIRLASQVYTPIEPVRTIESTLEQKPDVDIYQQAAKLLWGLLYGGLNTLDPMDEAIKAQLYGINIVCTPPSPDVLIKPQVAGYEIAASLSGAVSEGLHPEIVEIAEKWINSTNGNTSPIGQLSGYNLYVKDVSYDDLVSVPELPTD
ncbi:MAG: DUF4255 domain-containing protein [Rhodobacteraceae bacterium]|nr:DUF4255 domain-containing protein [Paracoccaceae bacterium]